MYTYIGAAAEKQRNENFVNYGNAKKGITTMLNQLYLDLSDIATI
jgi:hypothetical protein